MKLWYEKGAWASKKGKKVAAGLTPESVRSILIIRHAAIGDMMVLRPFLIQARSFFPNAEITLSVIDTYRYGSPDDLVDRIHVVDKKINGRKTSFFARLKQIRELDKCDILFDMADTATSGMVSLFADAKLKIGFPYRQLKNHLFFDVSLLRSDLVPEVDTLLHMLYILGAPKQSIIDYGYPLAEVKTSRIIYFMGASMVKKQWPKALFAQLIQKMAICYPQYEHVMLEGIKDDEKVDDLLLELKDYSNIRKIETLPLEQTMSYLSESKLVVCNDTGIRNMAIAVETATVGIFFFTVPYRYLPKPQMHVAVFNPDGSVPSVEAVFEMTQQLLNRD